MIRNKRDYNEFMRLQVEFSAGEQLAEAIRPIVSERLSHFALRLYTEPIDVETASVRQGVRSEDEEALRRIGEFHERLSPLVGKEVPLSRSHLSINIDDDYMTIGFELDVDDLTRHRLSAGRIFTEQPAINETLVNASFPVTKRSASQLTVARQTSEIQELLSGGAEMFGPRRFLFGRQVVRCTDIVQRIERRRA
jgi:hypothetical protein